MIKLIIIIILFIVAGVVSIINMIRIRHNKKRAVKRRSIARMLGALAQEHYNSSEHVPGENERAVLRYSPDWRFSMCNLNQGVFTADDNSNRLTMLQALMLSDENAAFINDFISHPERWPQGVAYTVSHDRVTGNYSLDISVTVDISPDDDPFQQFNDYIDYIMSLRTQFLGDMNRARQ